MTPRKAVGTVRQTVPNLVTESSSITSPTSASQVGTVGTVFPNCTYVRAGMNIERARADFPETQGELSPTVPIRKFDVRRTDPILGVLEKLGTVKARHLIEAQVIADIEFKAKLKPGQKALTSPAGGGRRRPPRRKS